MPGSDGEGDTRFRIPRGSSDEEIDSDLASIASNEVRTSGDGSSTSGRRDAITAAAGMLRQGLSGTVGSDSEPEEDDLDEPDAVALSAITMAATGRRDLSGAARRAAREVLPAGKEKPLPVPHRDGQGQGDMMARMLHVLSGSGKDVGDGASSAPVAGLADLKKKVARLSASGKKPLAVPLPEPVKGRIERNEAYRLAKEEVSEKWAGVVAKNRKSDKLVFPMGGMGETIGRNTGVVAEGFKAANEYEKEIEHMLKEAGVVNDVQVVNNEERDFNDQLGVAGVSKEELLERRRELAKVRSLMFHYEHKMKRIKKIKSRKYRRIMKKEKERLAEKRLDASDDEELEDEMIRKERKRAEERMTLRHKNTSKWVRRQLQRGETKRNPETRAAVEEQLQLHEELKRRQEGVMEDSDASDSDNSAYGGEATEEQLDAELEEVCNELAQEDGAITKPKKKKGLMGMRFMEVAQERQRKEAQALLEEMRDGYSDHDVEDGKSSAPVGRQSFSGGAVEDHEKANGKRSAAMPITDGVLSDDELSVGGDEADDARNLKNRVILEYEESARSAAPGMGGLSVGTSEKLSEALMESSKTKAGFTTSLDGKLKATTAADNPWLRMPEKDPSLGKENVIPSADDDLLLKVRTDGNGSGGNVDNEKEPCTADSPWLNNVASGRAENATAEPDSNVSPAKPKKRKGKRSEVQPIVSIVGADIKTKEFGKVSKKSKKRKVQFAQSVTQTTGETKGLEAEAKRPGQAEAPLANGSKHASDSHTKGEGPSVKLNSAPSGNKKTRLHDDSEEEDEAGSDWESDLARMRLVAKAFEGAGGADEADFEALKEAQIARLLPSASDVGAQVLPGWGNWDGAGVRKRRKERAESAFARAARERLAVARSSAISKRKDRDLKHVILDERRVKQAAELTLASVPFPFTSPVQWRRELDTPVCKELVTGNSFKDHVAPRVRKKVGVAIEPIKHGELRDKKRRKKFEERESEREGKKARLAKKGKRGVIDMRKKRARERNAARKGLMS